MFRLILQIVTTVIFVANVVSLAWFLIEIRNVPLRAGKLAAAALALFFAGLLLSQAYMVLVNQWADEGGDPESLLTPFWPLAVLSIVGVMGGGAWLAWLFRPRRVPTWLWALSATLLGLALGAARWAFS